MTEMDSCELLCKISLRHTVAGSMQNMAILMQQQNFTSFIAHYGLHLPTVLMFSFFNIDRFQKHINAIHWNAFKKTVQRQDWLTASISVHVDNNITTSLHQVDRITYTVLVETLNPAQSINFITSRRIHLPVSNVLHFSSSRSSSSKLVN